MSKIKVFTREREAETAIEKAKSDAEKLQQVVDQVAATGLFEIKNIPELEGTIRNPSYLEDRLIEQAEPPTFLGFKMKRKAIIESFELPDLSAVKAAIAHCLTIYSFEPFTIAKGKVTLTSDAFDKIKEQHTLYTRSEHEAEILEAYRATIAPMNNLLQVFKKHGMEGRLVGSMASFNYSPELKKLYQVTSDAIKQNDSLLQEIHNTMRPK